VKDGNIEGFFEPLLHLKAAGSADVLQVDSPEDGLNSGYGVHYDRRVLGIDSNGKGIDSGKVLEEYGFSLHHRYGSQGPYVSQTQYRGSISYHRHQIAFGCVLIDIIGALLNLPAGLGYAGGVSQGEISYRGAGDLAVYGNLARGRPMKL